MSTISTNQNHYHKYKDKENYSNEECISKTTKVVFTVYMAIIAIFITVMTAISIDVSLHPVSLDNVTDIRLRKVYIVNPVGTNNQNDNSTNNYYSLKTVRNKSVYVLNVSERDNQNNKLVKSYNKIKLDSSTVEIVHMTDANTIENYSEPYLEEYEGILSNRKFFKRIKLYKLYIPSLYS